ncbi:helix-turn-helix domain-containing protein [Tsuneonella sp. CC-YZS046]|uniref:winged helix-turn-helix transcriptional regulator n=1 Tax=Tsuneonella sp. CC-YZS046 TaxID=3042152 RepID=UPI002D768FFE|nr:helix-turn-helix domain-containing protein [Tsuneonella sp. CC-YZS046]WRO67503.1 helix-turn-helix domain-containing protein [Tsuneonella sp. CC-YZS046]
MQGGNFQDGIMPHGGKGNALGPPEPLSETCSSRRFIELIGNKWVLLILIALRHGPRRNGALKREIEGISQKVLTQVLRRLEANGLVQRRDLETSPPHVEYSLTELGRSLESVMHRLDDWFADHLLSFSAGLENDGSSGAKPVTRQG